MFFAGHVRPTGGHRGGGRGPSGSACRSWRRTSRRHARTCVCLLDKCEASPSVSDIPWPGWSGSRLQLPAAAPQVRIIRSGARRYRARGRRCSRRLLLTWQRWSPVPPVCRGLCPFRALWRRLPLDDRPLQLAAPRRTVGTSPLGSSISPSPRGARVVVACALPWRRWPWRCLWWTASPVSFSSCARI